MSEVKWIKIVTDIFDDEKIKYIETLPSGDTIIVIWFRLLCIAGKSNSGGLLMMTDKIAYTDEMLSCIFNRDIKTIRLALDMFEKLEMIEVLDNRYYLSNWEKHQSTEKLDKIREKTRLRVANHRQKQIGNVTPVTQFVTPNVTLCNATELELDKELELDNKKELYKSVITYLNEKTGRKFTTSKPNCSHINARLEEGHTLDDFKTVIDNMCAKWLNDSKMSEFLRPNTLFGTKFEGYLNLSVNKGNEVFDTWGKNNGRINEPIPDYTPEKSEPVDIEALRERLRTK